MDGDIYRLFAFNITNEDVGERAKFATATSFPKIVMATVRDETLRVNPERASPFRKTKKPSFVATKFNLAGCWNTYSELNSNHLTLAIFITFTIVRYTVIW